MVATNLSLPPRDPIEGQISDVISGKLYNFPESDWDEDLGHGESAKTFMRRYQMGRMGIFGAEGSGKGVFEARLATWCKRIWPTRPLITDFYFTEEFEQLFGSYTVITPETLLEQIERTEKLASKMGRKLTPEELEEWVAEGRGGIALRNAFMILDEFDTWVNKRRTASKVNEMITGLYKRYRHFKLLIAGACPVKEDLDAQRVQGRFMYEVLCSPDEYFPDVFNYQVYHIQGIGSLGIRDQRISYVEPLSVYARPLYRLFTSDAPTAVMTRTMPKKKSKKEQEQADEEEYYDDNDNEGGF